MVRMTIEISLRDAQKANLAIDDDFEVRNQLTQEASNLYSYEWDEEDEEQGDDAWQLEQNLSDLFDRYGVIEYEIEKA